MTPDRIVVGLGSSSASMGALDWAIRSAAASGAELLVLTAYAEPVPMVGAMGAGVPIVFFGTVRERVTQWQMSVVTSLQQSLDREVRIYRQVVAGPPASALLSASREAAMLVLGSSGGRWQPTVRRCLRRSACRVAVIEDGRER